MVTLEEDPGLDYFHGYCERSRMAIDLVRIGVEDHTPREYLPKRSNRGG
jgi:hypothetical protein